MSEKRTQIGTKELTGVEGHIELPEGVEWYCPLCGASVAAKGECLVNFVKVHSKISEIYRNAVIITTKCQYCGVENLPPATK